MSSFPAPDLAAGYFHNGQVVDALQFDLEAEAGLSMCLTSTSGSSHPFLAQQEGGML